MDGGASLAKRAPSRNLLRSFEDTRSFSRVSPVAKQMDGLGDAAPSRERLRKQRIGDVGNTPVRVGFGDRGDVDAAKF